MFNHPGGRTRAQVALLQQIAAGGRIWRGTATRTKEETWHMKLPGGPDTIVSSAAARALAQKLWIEPTGLLYWRITAAGRAQLPPTDPA